MSIPKVSVIVPVYNAEKHLDECIESIVNQTLKDIQIILVDDGSSDRSGEIMEKWADKDDRIITYYQPNSGTGKAINSGLGIAEGEYIAEVDCDDWIDPEMYEELFNMADGADVVKSGHFVHIHGIDYDIPFVDEPVRFCPRKLSYMDRYKLYAYQPSFWSAIYRREFILENELYWDETPGAAFQDSPAIFKINSRADDFIFTNKCYYHWRCDEPHTTSSTKYPMAVLDIYKSMEKYLDEHIELQLPLRDLLSRLRLGTYSWNVTRIADEDKLPFAKAAQKDFLRDNDYQDFRLYDEQGVKTLTVWMASPEMIVNQVMKNSQKSHDECAKV